MQISKQGSNPNSWYGEATYQDLSDGKIKAMKNDYKIDMEKAYRNILDCDGGKFKLDQDPPTKADKDNPYPKCFLPMGIITPK